LGTVKLNPFTERPAVIPVTTAPFRSGWRWWVYSFLFFTVLLGGALALERAGLWPESFKTAKQRWEQAHPGQRPPRSPGKEFISVPRL
jgi:hypothetical protein